MAEKGPTVSAKQIAMSRALGAAFLSHQVEQLEKTVVASRGNGGGGNWRDRRQPHHHHQSGRTSVIPQSPSRRGPTMSVSSTARSAPPFGHDQTYPKGRDPPPSTRRKSSDEEREKDGGKDADVIVVDASVLVHALYQVKRWCQQGRQEIVIVPLEALNTLDLLKKGTSSLAQRARAASRILEAQVGTNPRIRVQSDDAFVLWDKIDFKNTANGSSAGQVLPSPEWVRRTICCAKWEATNPHVTLGTNESDAKPPRVLFAVLSSPSSSSPQSSPQSGTMGLDGTTSHGTTPVVPLPAPTVVTNKFEPRSAGTLVSHWAAKAGMEMMEIEASVPGHGRIGLGEDEDNSHGRAPKVGGGPHGGGHHGYAGGHYGHSGHGGHGRRKASLGSGPGAFNNIHNNSNNVAPGSTGLVERPPAVMAMMEMVSSQPSNKGKVVRVLARGEKLDP